jgi:cytochrome d oxidase subunit CydB
MKRSTIMIIACAIALVFGVAFGNLLQGVPFEVDAFMRSAYTGSFWQLLNPFALLAGVVSLTMLTMHGAVFLQLRTEGEINRRARKAVRLFGIVFIAAFIVAGIWQFRAVDGYRVISMPDPGSVVTPLDKRVEIAAGAWQDNYGRMPLTIAAGGRLRRGPADHHPFRGGSPRAGIRHQRDLHRRGDHDGRGGHVPLRDAVQHDARCRPDRL